MTREQAFPELLERVKPECDRIIARYEEKRSALLMLMHVFQALEGFVSPQAIGAVSEMLGITPAETESTVSFYTLLYPKPVGKYMLQPCRGLACAINGADDVMAHFREKLGIGSLQTTADGTFSYEEVECLAACDRAPCMQVNLEFVYDLTPAKVDRLLAALRDGALPIEPIVQSVPPEATWKVRQDDQISTGRKSPGSTDVQSPNNAGGVGDKSGTIMLDHIIDQNVYFFERTRERAILDSRAVVAAISSEEKDTTDRAGH